MTGIGKLNAKFGATDKADGLDVDRFELEAVAEDELVLILSEVVDVEDGLDVGSIGA